MTAENTIAVQSREELTQQIQQAALNKTPLCVYRTTVPPGGQRLDPGKMNKLLEIDADNLVATVEPGLNLGQLAAALAAKGLRFLPADSPYYRHLSVGEWVYHGCPNPSSWKYRAGKHTLMGATYILPSGKPIRTGGKTVKNVTGYDFTRFLAGAYADIGIGVEFLLKLLPLPEYRLQLLIGFDSLPQVFGFISSLRQNPSTPAFLLAADARTARLLLEPAGDAAPFSLELELDGVAEEVAALAQAVRFSAKNHQAVALTAAEQPDSGASLQFGTIFSAPRACLICDEWKIPYGQQAAILQQLMTAYPDVGWFGQWAEGKVHAVLAGTHADTANEIARITGRIIKEGGISSGLYERRQGRIPAGPLRPLEAALRTSIDPEGIFTPKEVLS